MKDPAGKRPMRQNTKKGVILFRARGKLWVLFVCPYVDKTKHVATKTFSMWFKSTLAWDLVGEML